MKDANHHHHETHRLLREITKRIKKMADALAELRAAVEESTTVDQSVLTLVDQLASALENLPSQGADTVPASEVFQLATQIRTNSQQILAKVKANTKDAPTDAGNTPSPTDPTAGVQGSVAGTPKAEDGTPAP